MNKQKDEAGIVQRVLRLLLRQGICYDDDQVVEVRLDELAEYFASELGGSIDSATRVIEAALDRHPEILSKRVHQGTIIYETTIGTCREATSQRTSRWGAKGPSGHPRWA